MKRHLKRSAAALAAFAATLLVGHAAALVSTSPDLTIGGENTPSESPPPSSAALGHVKVPTTFDTNVYLHDAPTVPLHLRLAGAASGDITPHSITLQGERIEEWDDIVEWLQGELQGPAWLTPARFKWQAESVTVRTETESEVKDENWAVLFRDIVAETRSDYLLTPDILRNQWDAAFEASASGPATLAPVGNGTWDLEWDPDAPVGSTATISGQLGDWRDQITLQKTSAGQSVTQTVFESFAPGGVRATLAGVLAAWTNKPYGGFRFANYANKNMTNWTQRTNGYVLAEHSWQEDCDLSGVSFLNDSSMPFYKPLTLVSTNFALGVAHFFPAVGVRVCWMGKDGQPHASKLVDRRILNYDLAVGRIDPPIPDEICTSYPILLVNDAEPHTQAANNGTRVVGLPPLPVLAFAQQQRAWIMDGGASSSVGYNGGLRGIWDADAEAYIRNSRECAVGGDSGHPCFTSLDGSSLILIGNYSVATGATTPGEEFNRPLVEQAIASMGGNPSVLRWVGFEGYPVYLGPGLNMGGGSSTPPPEEEEEGGGEDDDDGGEQEEEPGE